MNKFAVIAALVAFTGARRHHSHHRAAEMGPYQFVRVQMGDPEADLAAAASLEDTAKTEVDADSKKDLGKTPAEKAEAADKEASKSNDKLAGELVAHAKAEDEEAAKEEQAKAEEKAAARLQENWEHAQSHDYFDGGAWTSDMPESIINSKPGKLNHAYSQLGSLRI